MKKENQVEDWIDIFFGDLQRSFFGDEFNEFWLEIEAYANEHRIPTRYVEEEFILEGEFLPIPLTYEEH